MRKLRKGKFHLLKFLLPELRSQNSNNCSLALGSVPFTSVLYSLLEKIDILNRKAACTRRAAGDWLTSHSLHKLLTKGKGKKARGDLARHVDPQELLIQ